MQEGVLEFAPYALLFWISRGICPTAPHVSVYLKANKDYNNEFLQDRKILKVGVFVSAPPESFFQQVQKFNISNFREGILSGGAYVPPVLK